MSFIKRAGDLIYTFRFLKLLTTPFEKTEAYALGIINKDGSRNKNVKVEGSEMKDAYTPFHKLTFNLKRLINKVPGTGSGTLASYAAALYLIKERYNITNIDKILIESGITQEQFLDEQSQWFIMPEGQLAPGVYRVMNERVINITGDPLVNPKDQIRVQAECYPKGDILGMSVYEVTHIRTDQKIYVTAGELLR